MRWSLRISMVGLACFLSFPLVNANDRASSSKKPASEVPKVFLTKWVGPYGGVPPFDQVKVSGFKPVLEGEMAESLAKIDTIAANPATPSFENTIAVMELVDEPLERANTIYEVWASTMA